MKDDPSSSHKKRKLTRLETTIGPVAFSARKKQRAANGGNTGGDSVIVTQSQSLDYFRESPSRPSPFASPTIRLFPTPLADAITIADMVTGGPVVALTLASTPAAARQLFDVPAHNSKKSTSKAVKLTAVSVFPWLRQANLTRLKTELQDNQRKESNSSSVIKRALNFFDNLTYRKHVKVQRGKSVRLATKASTANNVTPEPVYESDQRMFDVINAKIAAPDYDWEGVSEMFSLEARRFRRYVVEDLMFSNPDTQERLMLLVSSKHPMFSTVWVTIYYAQRASRPPISIGNVMFFQIEATVVKNSRRQEFIDGQHNQSEVMYLLTEVGGAGVCLHFPNCERSYDMELKFVTLMNAVDLFQVWGTTKSSREFAKSIQRLRSDATKELYYSHFLSELHGDHSQTLFLSANYNNAMKKQTPASAGVDLSDDPLAREQQILEKYKGLSYSGDHYTTFVQHVDGVFKSAVDDCYGKFVSLTTPIVSQTTMIRLVEMFKARFEQQYWAIATLLNYTIHMKKERSKHLFPFYDRMIFYHFLSMCRVRSHKTFSWWALVNACMRYGSAVNSGTSGLDSVFFGHSIVPNSVMRKTKGMRVITDAFYARIIATLHRSLMTLSVFDNTQTGITLKFQRQGQSSIFIKMTARLFVQLQHFWESHDLKKDNFNQDVEVTFLKQTIQSPYGMPLYQNIHRSPEFAIESYDHDCYASHHGADFSGSTVMAYVQLVFLSEEMKAQQRFLSRPKTVFKFVPPAMELHMVTSGVREILEKNRSDDGLFARSHKFQRESVKKWKGEQHPAKLLTLPLSIDDETRTEECGNVLLSLLEMSSIIQAGGPDKKTISLPADYDSRWQITVGDGLSQMRMRQYHDMVDGASVNFRQYYRQSLLFSKALDRVVMVPGDLHGGGFHFLAATFLLYYGAFLQPIQFALGWKRIRGSDVTKTYQQCASLAIMVLGEVERGLYYAFVKDLLESLGPTFATHYAERPKAFSTFLAKRFITWIEDKTRESTDEVFRVSLLYLQVTRKYKLFRLSVRNGDAVMVEYLYMFFIPIWLMCGKHNYVEIGLNQIEDLYRRIPFHVLQAVRENRMQPLHPGVDRDGVPMAQWALDAIMELLQIKYKDMNFPNDQEGWQKHSTNMPLVSRCKIFAQTEYSRSHDVESYDEQFLEFEAAGEKQDKGNCKTQTKVPRRGQEKAMIAEILALGNAFTEIAGRKMEDNTYWNVLKLITTTLNGGEEKADADQNKDGRSTGEEAMCSINKEMADNTPGLNETPDEVEDAPELERLEWLNCVDGVDSEFIDDDEEELEREMESGDATGGDPTGNVEPPTDRAPRRQQILMDDSETEVIIGIVQQTKVNVNKAKFNRLGVVDLVSKGEEKMTAMNIPEIRFRKRCRLRREKDTLQKELDSFLNNEEGSSKLQSIVEGLTLTEDAETSDKRVEFRLMKKGIWVIPQDSN